MPKLSVLYALSHQLSHQCYRVGCIIIPILLIRQRGTERLDNVSLAPQLVSDRSGTWTLTNLLQDPILSNTLWSDALFFPTNGHLRCIQGFAAISIAVVDILVCISFSTCKCFSTEKWNSQVMGFVQLLTLKDTAKLPSKVAVLTYASHSFKFFLKVQSEAHPGNQKEINLKLKENHFLRPSDWSF